MTTINIFDYLHEFNSIINDYHHTCCPKLLKKIEKCPTIAGKIEIFEKNILPHKIAANKMQKDDEQSEVFQSAANFYFNQRSYKLAMLHYNKSICFSKNASDISIAYANRSSICMISGMYEECVLNINLARKTGCPKRLRLQLDKRMSQAKELINQRSIIIDNPIPNLSLSHSKYIPFITDCLQLRITDQAEMGIVSKNDLKRGDVIGIEEPFAMILDVETDQYLYRCTYCIKLSCETMIPCNSCTFAMYCNEDCRQKAFHKFHKYECPLINVLIAIRRAEWMSLRILLTAISEFNGVRALKTAIDGIGEEQINPFTMNYSENTYKQCAYKILYNIITPPIQNLCAPKIPMNINFFDKLATTTFLLKFLKHSTDIGKYDENENNIFTELLYRHLIYTDYNLKTVTEEISRVPCSFNVNRPLVTDFELRASAFHGFASLFKNSVIPNVRMTYIDSTLVMRTLMQIPKGTELIGVFGNTDISSPFINL